MAVANGFGKTVTSGSVFMYDTGDTVNSYIGEPTTNMWGIESGTNVNNRSTWSMPYAYNGSITDSVYSAGTWNGNRIWEVLHTAGTSGYAGFESWRLCVNQPTAGNTIYSTTRRVAIKICILEGSITDLALHSGGGNSSHNGSNWTPIPESQVPRDCPQKTGWYQFLADGSWASNSVGHCVGLAFISYNRVRILTTEPMYYPSNKLLPFTGYQRSSTQGLLPIVGSSTIDLSSVSFDSNAQFLWDGTDDTLSVNDTFSHKPGLPYTYEIVVTPLGSDNAYDKMLLGKPGWHTGIMYQNGYTWFRTRYGNPAFYDAGWYLLSPNTYYHLMAVYVPGTSMKFYVNGVLNGENTSVSSPLTDIGNTLNIGGSSTNYSCYVKIPVAKVYNRALSAAEVRQNYNKYKTRFNLP